MILVGVSSATADSRPMTPFGRKTVAGFPDPLVHIWNRLRDQLQLDDLIVSSCIETKADNCTAAEKLISVVDDARHYSGRAMIAHINRSLNLMIKPSAGSWKSALEILKSGSGDCKDYSIAKYVALLRAGIPPSNVRLLILHDTARKWDHMVVGVYDNGQWLLLDNLTMFLVTDTERSKAYVPTFMLDETGVYRYIPSKHAS